MPQIIHFVLPKKNNFPSFSQAFSAYLSPPIAMTFCLAICWRRMNERGAFWGLMAGTAIGVVRMGFDFSYSSPLCMEADERPAWIGQVRIFV